MRNALAALGFCFAMNIVAPLDAALSPQERYLDIYLQIGKLPYEQGDHLGELARDRACEFLLMKLYQDVPSWEPALLQQRLAKSKEEMARLEPLATRQVLEAFALNKIAQFPTEAEIQKALRLEQAAPLTVNALFPLMRAFAVLQIIQNAKPEWEKESVEARLKECQAEFDRLQVLKE